MNIKPGLCFSAGCLFIMWLSVLTGDVHAMEASDEYPEGYYNGDPLPEKTAYLTFDDGPSEWTDSILDILKKEKVKATFFISAYWNNGTMKGDSNFRKYSDALKRMVNEGHVMANHTSGHRVLPGLSPQTILYQFNSNQRYLEDVFGKQTPVMTIIRPPLGSPWSRNTSAGKKKYVGSIVRKIGIVAMWTKDFDSTDSWNWAKGEWFRSSPRVDEKNPSYIRKTEKIYNRIVARADGCGMVILMHDTHPTSRDVLDPIISELKRKGYRFCTIEDLVQWKYGKSSKEMIEEKN